MLQRLAHVNQITIFVIRSCLLSTHQKLKLTLFTKDNCPLCEEAKEFIEENFPNKFSIDEVDITKNRDLFRKFKLDIPVFYFNDKFLMKHKADKNLLEKLLNNKI